MMDIEHGMEDSSEEEEHMHAQSIVHANKYQIKALEDIFLEHNSQFLEDIETHVRQIREIQKKYTKLLNQRLGQVHFQEDNSMY